MTLPDHPETAGDPPRPAVPWQPPLPSGGGQPVTDPAPGWVPPGYPPYPGYVTAPARPTNGLAIGSLVTSIAAFMICGGLLGVVGAILGHIARKQIRERGEDGDGMALAGIIVGWIGFVIGLLVIAVYIGLFAWFVSNAPSEPTYY